MTTARFVIEGPLWAQIGRGLEEAAFLENLEIELRSERKGWFRETIFGTVVGETMHVTIFMEALRRTAADDTSYKLGVSSVGQAGENV